MEQINENTTGLLVLLSDVAMTKEAAVRECPSSCNCQFSGSFTQGFQSHAVTPDSIPMPKHTREEMIFRSPLPKQRYRHTEKAEGDNDDGDLCNRERGATRAGLDHFP
jgi:hypothetical protein